MVCLTSMYILSVLTAALLALIISLFIREEFDTASAFSVLLIIFVFIGWGLFGNAIPLSSTYELISREKMDIVKTNSRVGIEYDNKIRLYEDAYSYNAIDSAEIFWIKRGYNTYGKLASKQLNFSVDTNDIPEQVKELINEK